MPYRLDTYDAMASLGVIADTSMKRRSIATPTPSSVHLSGVERPNLAIKCATYRRSSDGRKSYPYKTPDNSQTA
jgi:hypothetical protein